MNMSPKVRPLWQRLLLMFGTSLSVGLQGTAPAAVYFAARHQVDRQ